MKLCPGFEWWGSTGMPHSLESAVSTPLSSPVGFGNLDLFLTCLICLDCALSLDLLEYHAVMLVSVLASFSVDRYSLSGLLGLLILLTLWGAVPDIPRQKSSSSSERPQICPESKTSIARCV